MTTPNRKLPRLRNYDYSSPGAYFITICTHNKECLFGKVIDRGVLYPSEMRLSPLGSIVQECILDIPSHYRNICIDNWIVMPNHVHLLIQIEERINPFPAAEDIKFDIPNVIGKFKAAVTRAARRSGICYEKLWQSSYHDHIIRNEKDYLQIWHYINENAEKWLDDCFFCK